MKWICVTINRNGTSYVAPWTQGEVDNQRRATNPARVLLDLPGLVVVSRIGQLGWFVYIREDLIGG